MSNCYIRGGKEYTVPEALKQIIHEARLLSNEFCLVADNCEFYDEDKDICHHENNLFLNCVMNKCPFGKR